MSDSKHRLKNEIREPFTMISNSFLACPDLSSKAKLYYAYLRSKPPGWTFYISAIVSEVAEGRHAVATGMDELEEVGLIERKRERDSKGQFRGTVWTLHDPRDADIDLPALNQETRNRETLDREIRSRETRSRAKDAREDCSNKYSSNTNNQSNTEEEAPAPDREAEPGTPEYVRQADDLETFVERAFDYVDSPLPFPDQVAAEIRQHADDATDEERRQYVLNRLNDLHTSDQPKRNWSGYVGSDATKWRQYLQGTSDGGGQQDIDGRYQENSGFLDGTEWEKGA